jgi:hypothetical protein
MATDTTIVELQAQRGPAAVEQLIRQGQAERLANLRREEQEKTAEEKQRLAKESAAFLGIVDAVNGMIPDELAPFTDYNRDGFQYPTYDGHVVYLNVPGCTRVALGFGERTDRDGNRSWAPGAGWMVAVPYMWESDDDGWLVMNPQNWPIREGTRGHGWDMYPSLTLALAAAREQFGRLDELQAEANAKNFEREERRAAREKSRADRLAARSAGEVLLDALREYVLSMPIPCDVATHLE